jgi:hypothetical protein
MKILILSILIISGSLLTGCKDKIPPNSCVISTGGGLGAKCWSIAPYSCPETNWCFGDLQGCAESGHCPP